jgi:hypothetical protein
LTRKQRRSVILIIDRDLNSFSLGLRKKHTTEKHSPCEEITLSVHRKSERDILQLINKLDPKINFTCEIKYDVAKADGAIRAC